MARQQGQVKKRFFSLAGTLPGLDMHGFGVFRLTSVPCLPEPGSVHQTVARDLLRQAVSSTDAMQSVSPLPSLRFFFLTLTPKTLKKKFRARSSAG